MSNNNPNFKEFVSYPVMTEEVEPNGYMPSGARSGDYSRIVRSALQSVLNMTPSRDNPRSFVAALKRSFDSQEANGVESWRWIPRSYSVEVDMGAVTGAQASIYRRAQVAVDEALPMIDGLEPLLSNSDEEDVRAARAIVTSRLTELVGELGRLGGPRLDRADLIFSDLLGVRFPADPPDDPGQVEGFLGDLREALGLRPELVNTVDEERNLTNFLIVADYVIDLYRSWKAQRGFFDRVGTDVFLGTHLVLVERDLSVLAETTYEIRQVLKSVFVGEAEQNSIELELRPQPNGPVTRMTLAELLSWIEYFALEEGPYLIREAGKDGVISFIPTLARLKELVKMAHKITTEKKPDVPGLHALRTQSRFKELLEHVKSALDHARQIRRLPPIDISYLEPDQAVAGGLVRVEIGGENFPDGVNVQLKVTKFIDNQGNEVSLNPPFVVDGKNVTVVSSSLVMATIDLRSIPFPIPARNYEAWGKVEVIDEEDPSESAAQLYIIKPQFQTNVIVNPPPPGGGKVPPPAPGMPQIEGDPRIVSMGSGRLPPGVGDTLEARFKIRNSGGQTLRLRGLGIRGWKDNRQPWDFDRRTLVLAPGEAREVVALNQRPLEPGDYEFQVAYTDVFGTDIPLGDPLTFTVEEALPESGLVVEGFDMDSVGSGQWPPRVGDTLEAHFYLVNRTEQEIILPKVWIRGRIAGIDNWDFGWDSLALYPGEIREVYAYNRSPLVPGNYEFQVACVNEDGIEELLGAPITFTVDDLGSEPGDIVLEGFRMESVGSGQWPPLAGDRLIAYLRLHNRGEQTLRRNFKVEGRRMVGGVEAFHDGEGWDFGQETVSFEPDETLPICVSNERLLIPGEYSFQMVLEGFAGWDPIGSPIYFTVPGVKEFEEPVIEKEPGEVEDYISKQASPMVERKSEMGPSPKSAPEPVTAVKAETEVAAEPTAEVAVKAIKEESPTADWPHIMDIQPGAWYAGSEVPLTISARNLPEDFEAFFGSGIQFVSDPTLHKGAGPEESDLLVGTIRIPTGCKPGKKHLLITSPGSPPIWTDYFEVLPTVLLTFDVTVPKVSDEPGEVYIMGNFEKLDGEYDWTPGELKMRRLSDTHWKLQLRAPQGAHIDYRYTLGSLDQAEVRDEPRSIVVEDMGDGKQIVQDTVAGWMNS